jgi:hypothetical protein
MIPTDSSAMMKITWLSFLNQLERVHKKKTPSFARKMLRNNKEKILSLLKQQPTEAALLTLLLEAKDLEDRIDPITIIIIIEAVNTSNKIMTAPENIDPLETEAIRKINPKMMPTVKMVGSFPDKRKPNLLINLIMDFKDPKMDLRNHLEERVMLLPDLLIKKEIIREVNMLKRAPSHTQENQIKENMFPKNRLKESDNLFKHFFTNKKAVFIF